MKKRLLLFIVMALMMTMPQQMMADIEINEFTFPDENFRDYVWLRCDKNHDYVLTDEELLAVKEITITGNSDSKWASITSLDGIKNFISLEELYIGLSTQLSSINVSGCTSLKKINVKSHQGLSSINASGCTSLSVLYCNNSQLTTLDVSGCSALYRLECEKNQLTSLDVSECTALAEFRCDNNQLASLDVSECTALTELWCGNNQLTSLDVSGCTALTDISCYNNQLTSLDVSNNTALTRLSCGDNPLSYLDVSKNTALETLYCDNNQLTSLDVSKNTALTYLDCSSNQLTSLDVSKNTSLERLFCRYNQLAELDLSQNTALTELNVEDNQLTMLDLSMNTELSQLDCSSNQLESLQVSKNGVLKKIDCTYNLLATLDISQNTSIESIWCDYNPHLTSINVSGCTSLTTVISRDCQLTSLNVSSCKKMLDIDCPGNKLTSLDVSDCKELEILDCKYNQISLDAMDALIESLRPKNANERGGFYVLGDSQLEMNFITKEQVAAAKEKGWITYKNYKEYEGSEDLTGLLFTAKTKEGVDVIYQVTDAAEKLCQVGVERTNNRVYFAVEPQTTTLEIPEEVNGYKVTAIGADAFSNCEKLKNITMPNSVVSIGKNAFRQCYSLESIIIPSSVENIGSTAFCECNNLRSIYSEIVAPFDIAVSVFQGYDYDTWTFTNTPIYTEATLYVPEGSKEKYESAQGWNLFDKIVETGLGVVEEGQTIDFGTVINEGVDINGYLVDHIYICVSNSNGSYNAGDGCVVVTEATDDSAIDGKDIFGEDFKDGYTGIVFKVPSGEGTVKVDAATTGSMTLKVKIGSNEPIARTVEGRQILSFPYSVSEDTYVYIYGGMNAAGAKGMKKAADEDALKIYGIEVTSGTDGIKDIKNERLKMKDSPVYNLNGQRVISSPSGRPGGVPTKGVYIINGKKMVVK